MSNETKSSSDTIILFGPDDTGKPHASVFSEEDIGAAKSAAAEMQMHTLIVDVGKHTDLVTRLPAGRLFASGKAFVPFVKAEVYDQIAALAGKPSAADAARSPRSSPSAPAAVHGLDTGQLWEALAVDQLVLAYDKAGEAWFPARISRITGKHVVVEWRDYPDEGAAQVSFREIGLMHPVFNKRKRA